MASTNLPGKVSRAVARYLVTEGVVPHAQCFYFGCRRTMNFDDGPIVDIVVGAGTPEPVITGNSNFTVQVAIKGIAVLNPEDDNEETERVTFDAMVGAVRDALMLSDDDENSLKATAKAINAVAYDMPVPVDGSAEALLFAQNNADMDNFTLMSWVDSTYGQGKAEDCHWEIVMNFSCAACETKLAGYV